MKKGYARDTVTCSCYACGSGYRVSYDIEADLYICFDCVVAEEKEKPIEVLMEEQKEHK